MVKLTEERIEVLKIIVGLIIAIVGGGWTLTIYTENQRTQELNSMIQLGDSIAGMEMTCKEGFGELVQLADSDINTRKGRCYSYFDNTFKRSVSGRISIDKPFFYSRSKWDSLWVALESEIRFIAVNEYSNEQLKSNWNNILTAKGVSEKP